MAMMTKSPAARTALIYVTLGALTIIWTSVWLLYMTSHPPSSDSTYYFAGGLMATGVTVLVLGLVLGRIGRSAQSAELPPPELQAPAPGVQINTPTAPAVSSPVASGPAPAAPPRPAAPIDVRRSVSPTQPPVQTV